MATEANVTASDRFFVGEDKVLNFTVYQSDGVTPQDVATWALQWVLRKTEKSTSALIDKTTGAGVTITGVYNVSPALNTQKVVVAIADTDTDALNPNVTYRHALKRTDAGSETVLAFGDFILLQAAVR